MERVPWLRPRPRWAIHAAVAPHSPNPQPAAAAIARHLAAARTEGLTAAGCFPFCAMRTHTATSARFGRGGTP